MLENWEFLFMYAFTFFINGVISGTIGPLIPFLAAETHRSETDYSFVFICRSGGALLGAIIYKGLQYLQMASHHKVIGITSLIYIGCLLSFSMWNNRFGEGFALGMFSVLNYLQLISLNCSVLIVATKERVFLWFSICHGSFGIGALFAPLIVNLLTTKAYIVPAIFIAVTIPVFLFILSAPQEKEQQKLDNQKRKAQESESEVAISKEVSTFVSIFLGANCFLVHGIEHVIGGWISSYATMAKIADKKAATLFATLFWMSYTLSRLLSGCIDLKVNAKIKRLTQIGTVSAIVCCALSLCFRKHLATFLCSIFQGIGVSGIFPLTLSLSYEFNLYISQFTLSNIMLVMMLSEACIAYPTGFLMKNIKIQVFFMSLLLFNLILLVNTRWIIAQLEKEASLQKLSEQLKLNYFKFIQAEQT